MHFVSSISLLSSDPLPSDIRWLLLNYLRKRKNHTCGKTFAKFIDFINNWMLLSRKYFIQTICGFERVQWVSVGIPTYLYQEYAQFDANRSDYLLFEGYCDDVRFYIKLFFFRSLFIFYDIMENYT